MRIAYVFDPLLPCTETDTEQALNTVTALGKRGADVVMFLPREWNGTRSADDLRDFYKLETALIESGDYFLISVEASGATHSSG